MKTKFGALILASLVLSGCATIISNAGAESPGIYAGTKTDAAIVAWPVMAKPGGYNGHVLLLWPFALIDLPLSFVADTVILPYALAKKLSSD